MHDPTTLPPNSPGGTLGIDDADLRTLHEARSLEALHAVADPMLAELTDFGSVAVLVSKGIGSEVEMVFGRDCALVEGSTVECAANCGGQSRFSIPLVYSGESIGRLCGSAPSGPLSPERLAALERFADHFAIAFVNLRLNADALRTTEQYYASLQAFEEGVILFQEKNAEAIGARFLTLITQLLGTQVGALHLLSDVGDRSSPLSTSQVQGLPETFVDALRTTEDRWWPPLLLDESASLHERDPETGQIGVLAPEATPGIVENILHCPLRYHGIDVGVAIAFNVPTDTRLGLRIERARRLGELGAALFHRLALEEEALRSREFETQLSIASTIQARLIPEAAPNWRRADCAWLSRPAQHVGGDYVDLIELESCPLQAVVADVSGHGIDSAMLMASFRASLRAHSARADVDSVLELLNQEVAREVGDTGMFITGAILRFDADGKSCRYASAGHNPSFVYRAATGEVELLESTGPSLGMFAGMTYDVTDLTVETGDVILLYTDGIVEATDEREKMFGDDRLQGLLVEHAHRPASEIQTCIQAALTEFVGSPKCDDDVSMTVIRITDAT